MANELKPEIVYDEVNGHFYAIWPNKRVCYVIFHEVGEETKNRILTKIVNEFNDEQESRMLR